MVLRAEQLKMCFEKFCAVDGIAFEIARGECFGILGPNGAGKTTTVKMIYGALTPSSGELKLFNLSMNNHRREIKQKIGVVMQRDIHEESLSAWDNLRIHGRHYGLSQKETCARAEQLLGEMRLAEKAKEIVFRLSGGMKRRLSIAKGLINRPELLLLDEPTTGLDPQARLLLWDRIRDIKSKGTSILLTTHYMHEAEVLCDRLLILDKGKIVEQGKPKELIQKYRVQNLEEVFIQLTGRELRD